jgi:hypothetical protein
MRKATKGNAIKTKVRHLKELLTDMFQTVLIRNSSAIYNRMIKQYQFTGWHEFTLRISYNVKNLLKCRSDDISLQATKGIPPRFIDKTVLEKKFGD